MCLWRERRRQGAPRAETRPACGECVILSTRVVGVLVVEGRQVKQKSTPL